MKALAIQHYLYCSSRTTATVEDHNIQRFDRPFMVISLTLGKIT